MGTRRILLTWLVLLLCTLLFGVLGMRLLTREQRHLESASERAAERQLELTAAEISLTIQSIQDSIVDELMSLPSKDLVSRLLQLERENPLIAQSYVWSHNREVLHPRASKLRDPEREAFLDRYTLLFDGSVPWMAPAGESDLNQNWNDAENPFGTQSESTLGYVGKPQIMDVVDNAVRATKQSLSPRQAGTPRDKRWVSWYSEDQLYLLAIIEDQEQGQVFGVELETIALLSRLHQALPDLADNENSCITLRDRHGTVIHRSGTLREADNSKHSEIVVPVGKTLPTYELSGVGMQGLSDEGDRLFVLFAWLQIGGFMLAIMGAGFMLSRQAQSHFRDARQKTGFVSNVSHELKTPLTTIRMYAELLEENRVTDPTKRSNYLNVIVRESQRLTRLVNNVLDFGRLEGESRNFNMGKLDLVSFLTALVDTQHVCRDQEHFRLHFDCELPECDAMAEADALEQIILNVLDNAVKYASQGDGIRLSLHCADHEAHIEISDRGPGIPAAHRRKIFDKFHRVDDSLTSGKAGSGLGLSIARSLARGMDGDLQYQDREGGGSTFRIILSRSPEKEPQAPNPGTR